MTIRKYCKNFIVLLTQTYKACHRKRGIGGHINKDSKRDFPKMSDVTYYKYMKYVDVGNLYNVDSGEDFIRFATDHYGELGLSRLNIISFKCSISGMEDSLFPTVIHPMSDLAMEVAVSF